MERIPEPHNGLSQVEMAQIAQGIREQLRQEGLDPIGIKADDQRLLDMLHQVQMEQFERGSEMDSLDITELAIIVTDPDVRPPTDGETGVREPLRPQPSGSAGAIALKLAKDD